VEKKSKLESYLRGLSQSGSLGFADEITAGAESLLTDKPYQKSLDESREQYRLAQEENPKTYGAGELTADAASMLNPASGIAKIAAKKLALQRLAKGAAETIGRKDGQDLEASDALNVGLSGIPMKMKASKDIPWKTSKGLKVIDDTPIVKGKVSNPLSDIEKASLDVKGQVSNPQSLEDILNTKKILGK